MSMKREEYWTELQTIGATSVLIEMTRFGLLWHGNATIVKDGKRIDSNALAIAWGADQNQVYRDVAQGAHYSLERRKSRQAKLPREAETRGMFVLGTWRSFSQHGDGKSTPINKNGPWFDDVS